jgi:hypothetical protein
MRILPVTGCIARFWGLARALLYGTEASAPGCASAKLKGGFDEWNR